MKAKEPRAHRARAGVSMILTLLGCSLGTVAPRPASPRRSRGGAITVWHSRKPGPRTSCSGSSSPPPGARIARGWSRTHSPIRPSAHAQRSFVPVKLRSDLNEELALGFELSGLPATVIVAPSREVVAVRQGYLGPDELGLLLEQALSRHAPREVVAEAKGQANAAKPGDALPTRTKNETQVALSGYCPVSLVSDKRLVPGQAEYTMTHGGRLYRFANLITFNLFRGDPERYVPVNGGNCPVAQIERKATEPGDPRFGALFQGRLFLCASDTDRQRFLQDPARYAVVDVVAQGFCPHCLSETGLLVRGDPRVELNREGRRYWFPDPSHREAFLATSESSSEGRSPQPRERHRVAF